MSKLSPLTESERTFAEKYYPMIYGFLARNHLAEDEWFDIVALGYLEAVKIRFRPTSAQDRQYFPALACICMNHAVANEWRYQHAERRGGGVTISLDCTASADTDKDGFSLYALLDDPRQDVTRLIEARDMLERIRTRGTMRELAVLDLIAEGYEIAEAAAQVGVSERKCRELLRSIRAKAESAKHECTTAGRRRRRAHGKRGYRWKTI